MDINTQIINDTATKIKDDLKAKKDVYYILLIITGMMLISIINASYLMIY